jgi:hypothetical protein
MDEIIPQTTNIFNRPMTWLRRVSLSESERTPENIVTTTIGAFVDPEYQRLFSEQINAIRELCPDGESKARNKEQVDILKRRLPCGIISGVVNGNGIGGDAVKECNGILCIDIDAKTNPQIHDWEAFKGVLALSDYIAYVGLSVSGLGVFCLIAVAEPENYKYHYKAISEDLESTIFEFEQTGDTDLTRLQGVHIDQAPTNISSKRYVSFDEHPYINTNAAVYTRKKEPILLCMPRPVVRFKGDSFNLQEWLDGHGIDYTMREYDGGTQYVVRCPWSENHSSHSKRETVLFQAPGRPIYFKCLHDHCSGENGKTWRDYRLFYEPDAYNNRP